MLDSILFGRHVEKYSCFTTMMIEKENGTFNLGLIWLWIDATQQSIGGDSLRSEALAKFEVHRRVRSALKDGRVSSDREVTSGRFLYRVCGSCSTHPPFWSQWKELKGGPCARNWDWDGLRYSALLVAKFETFAQDRGPYILFDCLIVSCSFMFRQVLSHSYIGWFSPRM